MLLKLIDVDRELIKLRYGNDLESPITSKKWDQEQSQKFYSTLISKMKRLLSNPKNHKNIIPNFKYIHNK
jgi:hypothetical protein